MAIMALSCSKKKEPTNVEEQQYKFDPIKQTTFAIGGSCNSVFVDTFQNNLYAYIGGGDWYMVNVNIPSNPQINNHYTTPSIGGGKDFWTRGAIVYHLQGFGISSFLSGGVAYYDTVIINNYECNDFVVKNNIAYISNQNYGLYIVNIADENNMFIVSSLNFPNKLSWHIDVSINYAYIAQGDSGIAIIDITNPTNPVYKNQYRNINSAEDICINGNYAFVANYKPGLKILNISNPENPIEISTCNTPDTSLYSTRLRTDGSFVYMISRNQLCWNLCIVDVRNPSAPFVAGSCNMYDEVSAFCIFDKYGYITCPLISSLKIYKIKE